MSFHLSPMYHNNWFPFRSLNSDMRMMRNSPAGDNPPTIEPSYTYESDGKAAHFEIELPGVTKENLSIEVNGHKLVVTGKRFKKRATWKAGEENGKEESGKEESGKEESGKGKSEARPSLVYVLEARLGHGADLDAIKADHPGDGTLSIYIPLRKEDDTRRIEIGV